MAEPQVPPAAPGASSPLTLDWFGRILQDEIYKRPYNRPGNPTPVEEMFGRSSAVDAIRQALPESVGKTWLGQKAYEVIAGDSAPGSLRTRFAQGLSDVPLGGHDEAYLRALDTHRANDAQTRINTSRLGQVAAPGGSGEVSTKGRPDLAAAQALGVVAGDALTDGVRNVWWFLNAPQALASLAVLQGVNWGGHPKDDTYRQAAGIEYNPLLKNPRLRFAATVPAWMAMSAAIGSGVRLPGYAAAVPSEQDPTKTADPIQEVLTRYILGRGGSLLPYDEFVKERPDVSRDEYERYKAYLFDSNAPLKFTGDGIQGPEVTFLGKSMPVLTGLLPAAAAVVGSAYGSRRAARRLLGTGALGRARELGEAYQTTQSALRSYESRTYNEDVLKALRMHQYDHPVLQADPTWKELNEVKNEALGRYRRMERANDFEQLKDTLLFGTGGLVGASILGSGLESIRRAMPDSSPAQPQA